MVLEEHRNFCRLADRAVIFDQLIPSERDQARRRGDHAVCADLCGIRRELRRMLCALRRDAGNNRHASRHGLHRPANDLFTLFVAQNKELAGVDRHDNAVCTASYAKLRLSADALLVQLQILQKRGGQNAIDTSELFHLSSLSIP